MQSSDTQPTVLVVDHDVWERTFTTDVLANQGYLVLGASNGASGLRLAEQHPCDAILLDFKLPEVTGTEFVQRLKAMDRTRAIPVIGLGETPPDQPVVIDGCVPKPLNGMRVLSELGRCLVAAQRADSRSRTII
jgi:CheY-like chemotaxis protein